MGHDQISETKNVGYITFDNIKNKAYFEFNLKMLREEISQLEVTSRIVHRFLCFVHQNIFSLI